MGSRARAWQIPCGLLSKKRWTGISKEQSRIRTLQKTVDIGYAALNHWASVAYGKHINAMMIKEGSAEKVVEMLRRAGLPARLDLPELPNYGKVLP